MSDGQDTILRRLYHSEGKVKIAQGNVVIVSEADGRNEQKITRLHEDLASLLHRSGFHVSKSNGSASNIEIVLGRVSPHAGKDRIYAYYSGWKAHVGPMPPDDTEDIPTANPVMSLLVAGMAVSEAFRRKLDHVTSFKPSGGWTGNLPMTEGLPVLPVTLDFQGQKVAWVGCGSISFAALRALDGVRQVKGTLDLIDPANFNLSNCKKYLGLSKEMRGKGKAHTMAHVLRSRGIAASPFLGSLNEYGRQVRFQIPLAICAADSSVARRDLQAKLPKTVLNSWTGSSEGSLFTGASRHSFDGVEECLNCAYWEDVEGKANLVDVAMSSGSDSMMLFSALREGESFPHAQGGPISREARFLDGYANACEVARVQIGSVRREYSVPFMAAIGGALLALSIIIEGSEPPPSNRFHGQRLRFAMWSSFSSVYTEPMAAREGCICRDPLYRSAYAEMWGT